MQNVVVTLEVGKEERPCMDGSEAEGRTIQFYK